MPIDRCSRAAPAHTPAARAYAAVAISPSASRTPSSWVDGETFGKTFAIVPSGAMTKVARALPIEVLPPLDFSTQAPYCSATAWSASASNLKFNVVLVVERLDRFDLVGRDAEDDRVVGGVGVGVVADRAGLRRAAGRVGLWEKVEDDGLPLEV